MGKSPSDTLLLELQQETAPNAPATSEEKLDRARKLLRPKPSGGKAVLWVVLAVALAASVIASGFVLRGAAAEAVLVGIVGGGIGGLLAPPIGAFLQWLGQKPWSS